MVTVNVIVIDIGRIIYFVHDIALQISPSFNGIDRMYNAYTGARLSRMIELQHEGYYVVTLGTSMARVEYAFPDDGSARIIRCVAIYYG